MSNMIHVHVKKEDEFELTEEISTVVGSYEVLKIGEEVRVFTSKERVEELFNLLDKHLHENTYTELEDKCLNAESDLSVANERIEDLEDRLQENFKMAK